MKQRILLLFCAALLCTSMQAQTLIKKIMVPNGPVNTTAQVGDTVYLGGDFTSLYSPAANIARFSPSTPKADIDFPQLGGSDYVQAMEPDGAGGFYAAGYFDNFNGKALAKTTAVIHILSTGLLDAAFGNVNDNNGYTITSLKKRGNRLYVGGTFTSIQNAARNYLAALDATTGALLPWLPDAPDGYVYKIDATDSLVFISGNFYSVGGYYYGNNLAALKAVTGKIVRNFPQTDNNVYGFARDSNKLYISGNFTQVGYRTGSLAKIAADGSVDIDFPSTDGSINAVLKDAAGGWYIAGSFSKVGNLARSNIAHILANGTVDTAFKPVVNNQVLCLAASADTLYLGGYFTSVDGKIRNYLAGVSLAKGVVASWNPSPDNYVNTLAVYGTNVFVGGVFSNIKGTARAYAAAVSVANALLPWAPAPDSEVRKIILNSNGTSAYIGGSFYTVKSQTRPFIARVNTTTGDPAAWAPQPNTTVCAMALVNKTLYIGGDFTSVNAVARQYIAAVDTATAGVTSFLANADNSPLIMVADATKLYIGGNFTVMQGVNRKYAARVDIATGVVDSWNGAAGFDYAVNSIALAANGIVAGGNFSQYNFQSRNRIAAINLNSPSYSLLPWNPVVADLGSVTLNGLVHTGRDLVFAGNMDYTDNGKTVYNIIALHDSSGVITRHFAQYPNSTVLSVSLYDNKLVTAGQFGYFSKTMDASSLPNSAYIAAYDLSTWQLAKDNFSASGTVYNSFVDASGRLIIAGAFDQVNVSPRYYLAAINVKTGMATDFDPSVNGSVYSIALKDTLLFAAGGFNVTDYNRTNLTRQYIAAFSTKTGKTTAWNANANSTVWTLALKDTTLYAGGDFTNVKGAARTYAVAISTTGTGTIKPWAPNPNSRAWAILPVGSSVFVGGDFSVIKGASRQYLAKCNNTDGALFNWQPNPDDVVTTLVTDGVKIYAGGNFATIFSAARNGLAAFDTTALNNLTTFDAKLNSYPMVNSIVTWGRTLYLGGSGITTINGAASGILAGVDTATKKATGFKPLPDGNIYYNSLSIAQKRLAAGGYWKNLGANPANPYFALYNLQPIKPAASLVFSKLTSTSVKASVTKGDGDGRVFFVKADTLAPALPADGITYKSNTVYGAGDKKSDTSYAVYTGNLDSVTVTGLKPNKKYTFGIYEYNSTGSNTVYNSTVLKGTIITPCPVYNLHITPNDTIKICAGATTVLKAPAGFKTYKWNTNDTTASITKPAGNYSVNYTDTDGCIGTSIIAVVADAKPNLGKDSAVKVCPGKSVNITGIYNTTLYKSAVWNIARPDSTFAGIDTLIVTNTTGCKDTAVVTVTLGTKPALGADKSVKVCIGSTTNISTLYSTAGYTKIVWSTATPTTVGSGSYSLVVTNSTGCMDTAIVKVDTISSPKAPVILLSGQAVICLGDSTLMTASNYTDTSLKISWLKNDTLIANATGKNYYAKTGGAFKLRYTNTTGCATTSAATNITLGGVKPPVPIITKTGKTSFCLSDSLILTANATTGLQWYRNNTAIKLATTSKYVVRARGVYKLLVSGGASCSTMSDSVVVTVTQVAKPTITLVNDTLVSSSPTGNQWFENGIAIPLAKSQKYSPNDIDVYTVQVTSGACVSQMSDQFLYTANTLMHKKAGAGAALVYPNPAADVANLRLSGFSGNVLVTVTDMAGKVVYTQQRLTNSTYRLPLHNLAAGIYMVTVSDGKRLLSTRLIKAKGQTAAY